MSYKPTRDPFIDLASRRRRFIAFVIDMTFLFIVGIILGTLYSLLDISPSGLLAQAIALLIPAVYFIVAYSTSGETVGKRLMDIKVVSLDGKPLNWRNGVLRYVGSLIGMVPFFAGYWWSFIDYNKQAGHDKIAGTVVVRAAVPPVHVAQILKPAAIRRQRIQATGILVIMSITMFSGVFVTFNNALGEVNAMGPWPGSDVSPSTLVNIDFSHLGLSLSISEDARMIDSIWADGNYKEGAVAILQSGFTEVAGIWLLHYETSSVAAYDFGAGNGLIGGYWYYEPTANGTCISETIVYVAGFGRSHCDMGDAYLLSYWNDTWLLHIVTLEGSRYSPQELSVLIRDALTVGWKRLQAAS